MNPSAVGDIEGMGPTVRCVAAEITPFPAHRLAAAPGVRLEMLAGRHFLFSASSQALFEINDTAADIWRSFEDGLGPAAIRAEMVRHGVAPPTAEAFLDTAMAQWIALGLLRPLPEPGGAAAEAPAIQDIRVAGVVARIRHAPRLAPGLAPIFAHIEAEGERPEVVFDIIEQGERVALFRNGDPACSCAREEAATALKTLLLDDVLERGGYALALHAAALLREGRMLLLIGQPGAGKTTLALALVEAGFGFAGDDLALLDSAGQVSGVPFAPAVKPGAWSLVGAFRPDLLDTPIFRRPDGIRVRYPPPRALAPASAHPAGWLVALDRRPDAVAALTPLDPADAVRLMLQDAYTPDRRLHAAGFQAVARCLATAGCLRLTYAALQDAVALLHRHCR